MKLISSALLAFLLNFSLNCLSQSNQINWTSDGMAYTKIINGEIVKFDPVKNTEALFIKREQLTPKGKSVSLVPQSYTISNDNKKLLIFTNTLKVWRYKTKGDYWMLDLTTNELNQLGKTLPAQSLMFAKISPDNKFVAYVSEHNIYVEEISSGKISKLTTDGTRKLINGTFDWVYEEEFGCRDGFRWSPDSRQIAFWQIDAGKIRDFYMINNTDSVYSKTIPVEYPKVGEAPSPAKIGVISLTTGYIKWMKIEGDPQQHYITRMEWSGNNELVVQQLDRKQQESKLMYCNTTTGVAATFWAESDDRWVDMNTSDPRGWNWINGNKDFLWISEKDGWRHIYKISKDGKSVNLLTKGNYDIGEIEGIDQTNNCVYFTASPENSTQLYLYKAPLNSAKIGKEDESELVSPKTLQGSNEYVISPNGKIAMHSFSNHNTPKVTEWVSLPKGKPLLSEQSIEKNITTDTAIHVEYIKIKTVDNIELDAWVNKPKNFDPSKKYPLVVYVYGEPAATTTDDVYGNHDNFLFNGNMSEEGYIQLAIDNRGTPSLKGADWRKAIYRRNGQINIRDMAMGVKKFIANSYVDKDRVAVWGWSGGGSSTLHLMFQYPDIFKTGVAIAPVTNLLSYDNIYTERYMGLPQENMEDFIKGSAVNYAKNLKGNLLLIHGSGDDNVHYSNAETLINELVKYNKPFQFMEYPNRTHSISEGEGTSLHLSNTYSNFIRANCPPGAK